MILSLLVTGVVGTLAAFLFVFDETYSGRLFRLVTAALFTTIVLAVVTSVIWLLQRLGVL